MNNLLGCLSELSSVMESVVTAPTPTGMSIDVVEAYIRAIKRKAKFALVHQCVLDGIIWKDVDDIGRTPVGSSVPQPLIVNLHEATLQIHHPGAVTDHVYLAFDGLTAALKNMTDTLGRLVNGVYGLGIRERQASLLAVRDQCKRTSALGAVLHDPSLMGWLQAVAELRGRCQHADVEEVLATNAAIYAQRMSPVVRDDYCWKTPKVDTPIAVYAHEAMEAAETMLVAAVSAIAASPNNPTR
jgi:hypothetical protein